MICSPFSVAVEEDLYKQLCLFLSSSRIGGVMVTVLASSAVDHGFEPRSGQTKDYARSIK